MKKLIAALLALMLLMPACAMACEGTAVLIAKSDAAYTYTDASYWALNTDCTLIGIKDEDEIVPRMGVQSTHSQYVAGWLENGWTREAGAIRTVSVDGKIIGLAKLCNVTITIRAEYIDLAQAVIRNLLGEGVEISANAIAACAMWWDGDYVSMIFHPSYSDRFEVGYVTFNAGEDVTPLYLGHFGEELRFGLACGWWIPEPEPETVTSVQEQTSAQASAEVSASANASAQASVSVSNSGSINQSGDGCYRNNTLIQINLFSIIKQGIKIIKEACQ